MSCYYASLEQEALLHITGPDARSFLQGQVTCDTRKLDTGTALPGVYCTAQGRVVCDFLLVELAADHLALRLRRAIREASAAVLARYIIFSRATLASDRDDWHVLGCWGPTAAARLEDIFGAVPSGQYAARSGPGYCLVQVDKAGEQFECYLQEAGAASLLAGLESQQRAPESGWQALQIANGVARVEPATAGEHVPQALNYDATGHISFNKGCYTGQEVVARLHYRGKPKRRLYPATLARTASGGDTMPPQAGELLYCSGSTQAVGNVINCVDPGMEDLALLVTATAEGVAAGLRLQGPDGPLLQTARVPYPVPEK